MPTVGWSAVTGHGTVGVHEAPSSWVTDMTAHGPLSPPAMVVPVAELVAMIGSTLNCENGEDTSDHDTAGGAPAVVEGDLVGAVARLVERGAAVPVDADRRLAREVHVGEEALVDVGRRCGVDELGRPRAERSGDRPR